MFCDLVGFTTFSETRDPEDVRDVLEHYFSAARRVVAAYGGTIEKFIGDAVMAFWGAPIALEDDAERSVRAALDLTAAVAMLAQQLSIPELQLRGGVLTGEAAVDVDAVKTGMVIGDAVNTAARIQALAEPGTVLVDDITRLVSERSIAYAPAGVHAVKGRSATVRVWRATQVVSLRGGIGRSEAVEPPLVGRDTELGLIRDAFDRLVGPEPGIGLVTVIGDAGHGKTRLVWESQKYVDGIAAPVRWLRGRALGFGEGAGFSALAEIVRMGAGIVLEDPPSRQRALAEQWIDDLFGAGSGDRARVTTAVCRLLALDDGTELIEPGALFASWRVLFERLASHAPVALILEELHLADQGLFEFIEHLLEWAPDAPILVLALGRPHAQFDRLVARGEPIDLQPLSDDRMNALVSGVVTDAPPSLLDAVRVDGGGVPLYAVETLRSLADSGVLAIEHGHYVVLGQLGELTIPPTIRALVASRLDRLGPLERRLLAGGAVLGERFATGGAAALAAIDEADARTLLDGLVAKQLLSLETASRSPLRGRYCFLQGVVRRVLLSTLSRRVRKEYHLSAVEYLSRTPEPELASVLASHLLTAAEMDPNAEDATTIRERAGVTLREAAERAAAVGALQQALAFFDRAAELASAEHDRATILERAGDVAHRSGESDAAAERYRLAGVVHAAAGRERERLGVRTYELRALRYVRAPAELLDELRELDAALGDRLDERSVFAGGVLAFTLYQCGQPEEALAVARRAVDAAEACGARRQMIGPLGTQASSLAELERPEESIEVYRRALRIAERHDQRIAASIAGNIAVSLASLGNYAEAAGGSRDAILAAQRTGERFAERWSRLVLGRALCSLGDWDEAGAEIEAVKDSVPPFQIGMAIAPLVVIALARGQLERAHELVGEHDRRCSDAGASVFESDFRAIRATVLAIEAGDDAALAQIVPGAQVADYAEWTGWLAPVVDRLVANPATDPLGVALGSLREDRPMKRTPPVVAQAERLQAHLAARAGDDRRAAECWEHAEELAASCGLQFDAAVITLERSEHDGAARHPGLVDAVETFERLRAEPWLARARRAQMSNEPMAG